MCQFEPDKEVIFLFRRIQIGGPHIQDKYQRVCTLYEIGFLPSDYFFFGGGVHAGSKMGADGPMKTR